jgi:hypothetical protein
MHLRKALLWQTTVHLFIRFEAPSSRVGFFRTIKIITHRHFLNPRELFGRKFDVVLNSRELLIISSVPAACLEGFLQDIVLRMFSK